MGMFDNQNDDDIKRQIMLRSLMQDQGQTYGKPLIGNETTAGIARGLSNAADLFVGRKPQFPVQTKPSTLGNEIALASYKQSLKPEVDTTSPLPPGFVNVRGKAEPDPTYVKPEEQRHQIEDAKKAEEDAKIKQEGEDSLIESTNQNIGNIEEAKKGAKYFGPLGNMPTIAAPSTILSGGQDYGPRKRWETNVNQLLSQKVVDLIGEMKRVSKTGATGFGQLSDREGNILREASTALKKDLTPEDAMYYLNEMENIQKKFLGKHSQQASGKNVYSAMRTPAFPSGNTQKSYNSPEEADANEQPGSIVMVQGRKYQV